ncbi:MAG: S-layer homology domain-containing protein [Clostridia bacterium]|nr:S-layer homology domain-containing protein [Clostridia bacterium]
MRLKRILSAVILAAMLLGVYTAGQLSVSAEDKMPFADVGEKKWFYDEVLFVYEKGLMNGITETRFEPNGNLTRAMFITILGRLAGAEESESNKFPDVKKGKWYSGYVGWAVDSGIVTGYEDGTFKPNKALSREEMAACIYRYVEYMGINMPRENTAPQKFSDSGKIAKWARDYVELLRRSGIANGDQYEKYNPKANITRAEMATVIMNLIAAEAKAWQGYTPSADGESIILGAGYLYANGNVVAGGLGTDLDETGEYPSLRAYPDAVNAARTYLPENTVGVSFNVIGHDYRSYPYVKLCYSAEGAEPTLGLFNAGAEKAALTSVAEGEDNGFKTVTLDLSEALKDNAFNDSALFSQLLFTAADDADLNIRYIALFKDKKSADGFDSADADDYLKNYFLYSPVELKEADEATLDEYDRLLRSRIDEILNSESEITPEDIVAEGGTRYYISSINGDDNNDGLSPETAWKSLSKLWYNPVPVVELSTAKEGDAVFFERGSVFYPEKYLNNSKVTLQPANGVTYGAYGEGDKPLFTGAIDLGGGAGLWHETQWENIYVLDAIDPREDWRGEKVEVGNIVFNGGEAVGINIRPADQQDPFGEGKSTKSCLKFHNGYEIFDVKVRPCENPGTALQNDLEFIHDWKEGKLYLYCEDGNPADRFDEIMCGTSARILSSDANNVRVDNIAAKYSCFGLIDVSGNNVVISNCEAGYSCGSISSIDGSIGGFGPFDNYVIRNCYSHDIGDGAVTHQCTSTNENPVHIQNITYENNVFVATGIGIETWNHMGPLDENGIAQNRIRNITVKGNIMAYTGYGLTQVQGFNEYAAGAVIDSSMYGEFENCNITDNIFMYCQGSVLRAYFASDNHSRGWTLSGNTYIMNEDCGNLAYMYETMPYLVDHNMNKRQRIFTPYNERYIKHHASLGICENETFYIFSGLTDEQKDGVFFTTGYYVERGIMPR